MDSATFLSKLDGFKETKYGWEKIFLTYFHYFLTQKFNAKKLLPHEKRSNQFYRFISSYLQVAMSELVNSGDKTIHNFKVAIELELNEQFPEIWKIERSVIKASFVLRIAEAMQELCQVEGLSEKITEYFYSEANTAKQYFIRHLYPLQERTFQQANENASIAVYVEEASVEVHLVSNKFPKTSISFIRPRADDTGVAWSIVKAIGELENILVLIKDSRVFLKKEAFLHESSLMV